MGVRKGDVEMTKFTVGHNIAGYLPDDPESNYETDDPAEAMTVLVDTMREYADEDDECTLAHLEETADPADYEDDGPTWLGPPMRATVDAILRDDPPVEGQPFAASIEAGDGRWVEFWLHVE